MTVKELRTEANMTVDDLAWFFRIPRETIIAWEVSEEKCPKCVVELMEQKLKKFGFFSNDGKKTIIQTLTEACEAFESEKTLEFLEQKNNID